MEADGYTYDRDFPHALEEGFEIKRRKADGSGTEWVEVANVDYLRHQRVDRGYRVIIKLVDGREIITESFAPFHFRFRPAGAPDAS